MNQFQFKISHFNSFLILKRIKLLFKQAVFFLKSLFLLDKFNKYELAGQIKQFSNLKFIHRTQLNVPFSLGRSARGIAFGSELRKDPIFEIIYQASKKKDYNEIRDDFFEILKKESKLTTCDIVGLKNNKKLKRYPPWSYVLPWENTQIERKFEYYENSQRLKRKEKSIEYNFKNLTNDKNYLYSIEMAESQVMQSIRLLENISKCGYKTELGIPSFHILVKDKEWRWYMSQGNHRAYILYLLNYDFLYGTVDSVIYKEKSHLWPNVKNGLFNLEEAELVFDYLFEGKKSIGPCI